MQRRPKAATSPPVRRSDAADWGDEAAGAVRLASRTVGRVLSYILNILLTLLLIGAMTGAVVGLAFAIYVKNNITPDLTAFEGLNISQAKTTRTYYYNFTDRETRTGQPVELENMRMNSGTDRTWVKYADMPKYLIDAFTSIEDHRFWDHNGVDWIATAQATFWYFFSSGHHAGASTITQQLIKNVTDEDEITIQRKITEILRALELEKKYDKTEIIEMYLNYIFLSQHCDGVGAAAYKYFSKDVKDLSLLECAALAAIPKYPSKYDPIQHPENNLERRNTVLWTMLQYGKISQAEFDATYDKQLIINSPRVNTVSTSTSTVTTRYSWFQEVVIDEALELLSDYYGVESKVAWQLLRTGGYSIYTTLDPEVQNIVEKYYLDDANFPKANSVIQPQSAIAIVDPPTGDIVAVGGARGEKKGDRLFNYATAKRPPGSSIKPLTVYSPALQEGLITMASVFDDVPINFGEETIGAGGQTEYSRPDGWPSNYPEGYKGLTTILDGVTRSVNTISLQVLTRLGIETAFDYGANRYHLDLVESREITGGKYVTDKDLAPLGLGQLSYGVSVIEMAGAYATFINGGVFHEPHTILQIRDSNGDIIINNDTTGEVVLSEQNAFIMTMILQNVVKEGTAKRATIQSLVSCAGKTGTTQEDNDRWFCGFTPYYSAAVWFGYDMPKSLNEFTTNPSLKIWDDLMTQIHQAKVFSTGEKVKQFEMADGIVERTVCMDSGDLICNTCYADPRGNRAIKMYFTYATAPTEQCHTHVLVRYDTVNGGVATSDCPESECKYVGLLNITSRNFPFNITVQDAQYTWRQVPDGTRYTTNKDLPFYNCIMNGRYSGVSYSQRGYQYNRICPHYDPDRKAETEPPETSPPETSPPETSPPEAAAPQTEPAPAPAPAAPSDEPQMPTPADGGYYPEN
ncbi:MAG: transglycosylase domain-containing protein [Clostridia bacterium]|nr:transglycosylase domain-containing protein [Clostridia bacterium]